MRFEISYPLRHCSRRPFERIGISGRVSHRELHTQDLDPKTKQRTRVCWAVCARRVQPFVLGLSLLGAIGQLNSQSELENPLWTFRELPRVRVL